MVVRVFGGAGEVFDGCFEGLEGEDVGDWVGSLVGGPIDGVVWPRGATEIGDGGPGLKAVAKDVEA